MNAAREDFSPGGSVTSETESQIGPYRAKRVIGSKGGNHMEVIAVVTDRHGWLLWFQSADYLQQSVDQPLFVDSFHFYDNGQDCHLSLYMQTLGNGVTGSFTRAALR